MANMQEDEEEEGVLLYYKFVSIPDQHKLGLWFQAHCSSLSVVGRVRVAPDGVNVTIGGTLSSLRKHIDAVRLHPWLGECDFKLASAHTTTISRSAIAPEVGFSSLSVRIVKELVTLGVHPSNCPSISDAGIHLSAKEFHRKIQEGEHTYDSVSEGTHWEEQNTNAALVREPKMADTTYVSSESHRSISQNHSVNESKDKKKLVILDVRNVYETRIGKFVPPEGVDFLDPQTRQYSDLPEWIDSNAEKLQNKNILMYCTGGVRCEMASGYIKNKGKGFQNIFQLSGGIQRYLEAFPDGGFFKGKNFVFDYRVAIPSSCPEVLGTCLKCGVPFDDYSLRTRCSQCRMLVLICYDCQANVKGDASQPQVHLCELCKVPKNDVHTTLTSLTLCGQSSSKAAQQKINERKVSSAHDECGAASDEGLFVLTNDPGPSPKRKLRILCLHGFRQSASSLKGRLAAFTKKLKSTADFVFVDAPHEVPLIFTKNENNKQGQKASWSVTEREPPRKKFAWLVTPDMNLQVSPLGSDPDSMLALRAEMGFDKDQYKRQTLGWLTSLRRLEEVFYDLGPFDGVLGFSQGAAVAASLCLSSQSNSQANSSIKFRFVILCSGFISPATEVQALMSCVPLPLSCPSLHIFADRAGHDEQVVNEDSMRLRSLFDSEGAVELTHSLGHIVPTQKEKMEKVKCFLSQFT